MEIRLVEKKDMIEVIDMLQSISNFYPENEIIETIWGEFSKQPNNFSFVYIKSNYIVGYGSVTIEMKIRGGKLGHIEDIVVHNDYRGKGLGKEIINHLTQYAKKSNCYKVSLSCKDQNVKFYQKCGFEISGITMNKFIE